MLRLLVSLVVCSSSAMAAPLPTTEVVEIGYSRLIDGSQITHSGRTLAEELRALASPEYARVTNSSRTEIDAEVGKLIAKGEDSGSALSARSLQLKIRLADQRSLVEPFLEPYSFLLEDLLEATDSSLVRPNLVEVATRFPVGTPQPAWADLLRTRRYYVLSDGSGYARFFLPGRRASAAYQQHLPVLRGVIRFLLDSGKFGGRLTIDVYAYQNELAKQSLRLNLEKLQVTLTKVPASNEAINLGPIHEFLSQGLTLEGAALDEKGQLVLLGSRRAEKPTLESQPVTIADIAVAYRAVFYAGEGESFISLDRSSYAEQTNVNFGGRLQDTRIGWVALLCDMRFKTVATGFDPATGENLETDLEKRIPGFRSREARKLSFPAESRTQSESTRFWFYPDNINVEQSKDGLRMQIRSPRYAVGAERLFNSKNHVEGIPTWTKDAITHFNKNYDQFAVIFPEIRELDVVGRLLALFTWLKQKRIEGQLSIDLDPLLDVLLPECHAPRRMPQMVAGYYFNKTQQTKIWSINVSDFSDRVIEDRRYAGPLTQLLGMAAAQNEGSQELALLHLGLSEGKNRLLGQHPELAELKSNFQGWAVLGGGIALAPNPAAVLKGRLPEATDAALKEILKSAGAGVNHDGQEWVRSPQVGIWQEEIHAEPYELSASESSSGVYVGSGGYSHVTFQLGENAKPTWIRQTLLNTWDSKSDRTTHYGTTGKLSLTERVEDDGSLRYRIDGSGHTFTVAPVEHQPVMDANLLNVVAKGLATGLTPGQIWGQLPGDLPIAGFDRTQDGRSAILYGEGAQPVLRYFRSGTPAGETLGGAAFGEFEGIGRDWTRTAGTDRLKFVFASGLKADNVILQCGARQAQISAVEMLGLMDDPNSSRPSSLDELFHRGGEFVVYRDALDRRPEVNGGSLREGTATDPVRIATMLQERYPGLRVYLDDEPQLAVRNHDALGVIRSSSDLVAMVPEDAFAVEDWGFLDLIKGSLSSAGIKLADTGSDLGSVPNVLIINGNNEPQLVEYLTELGEQGFLNGRVILLNTCYARQNPNLFSELLVKYHPRAIFMHGEAVYLDALQRIMRELGPMLKEAETKGKPIAPADLLRNVVKRALADTSLSPKLRLHLKSLLNGVLQISGLTQSELSKGSYV